jgi:hypothetical protein
MNAPSLGQLCPRLPPTLSPFARQPPAHRTAATGHPIKHTMQTPYALHRAAAAAAAARRYDARACSQGTAYLRHSDAEGGRTQQHLSDHSERRSARALTQHREGLSRRHGAGGAQTSAALPLAACSATTSTSTVRTRTRAGVSTDIDRCRDRDGLVDIKSTDTRAVDVRYQGPPLSGHDNDNGDRKR